MNYTIGTYEQQHGNLIISIDKDGNKYLVCIWDKEKHVSTSKSFTELKEAYAVFEKLVSWCVFGFYSDSDKKHFLKTGTMN